MLFSRHKVAYERKRKIMRNVASVAELTKSFFAEIDKVEDCTRTVHERVVFSLLGLAFERKQIPRFVGNISS